MVAPIELAYTSAVALSPITNLHSLPDGNIWHSGEYNDPSPSNQAIRISYTIVLGAAFASDDRVDFWVARGDEAVSSEIWDGGMSTSEGRITTAATIAAAVSALGTPAHSPPFETGISTTLAGSFDVWDFGPSWQLCIRVVGNTVAASGSVVRYRYLTPAMSTDFETTVSITRDASGAVARTLQEYIDDTVFSPEDFGGVASDTGTHTAAFQAAIAAADLADGIVAIPPGTWALDANMTMQGVIMGYNTMISPLAGRTITIGTVRAPTNTRLFAGAGSIQITVTRPIYTEWFGAIADNTTDCAAAFTAASAALQDDNAYIQLLSGTYRIFSGVTFDREALKFWGASRLRTAIVCTHATANELTFISNAPVDVGYFAMNPSVTKTAGASVYLTAASGQNSGSSVHHLTMDSCFIGIRLDRHNIWHIDHCYIVNCGRGLLFANVDAVDSGDSSLTNCVFNNPTTVGTYAIEQRSSGGLKINNCKFLGHEIQYRLLPDDGVSTSILVIGNNSFETSGNTAISLNRAVGTSGIFGHVLITGNQFNAHGVVAIGVPNNVTNWLTGVVITGNFFNLAPGGKGISLSGQRGYLISGNMFNAVGGTTTGIEVGSAVGVGRAVSNFYRDVTTPVANASGSFTNDG